MDQGTSRRTFIKGALLTSAVTTLAQGVHGQVTPDTPVAAASALPGGKIGELEVSRLLLGGNLLTHYTHSRELKYVYNLAAAYNTEAKIIETLALAERNGINTLVVHTVPAILETLRKYRQEMGGKIQWIICPTAPVEPGLEAYRKQVEELVDMTCDAVYLWGVHADRLAAEGRVELMAEAVALVKEYGLPSGLGGHDLEVVRVSEAQGVDPDFYIKTFHHHDYQTGPRPEDIDGPHKEIPGYWCASPEDTIRTMQEVEKPWIAFKVMAAGAIPPEGAFQYAFDHGADHILAGMFDFEIAQDAQLVREALAFTRRERVWRS
jgi:hypothetical protein